MSSHQRYLSNYSSDYKSRLVCLQLLPLMMQFELNDIIFLVTSIQNPSTCIVHHSPVHHLLRSSIRASVNYKLLHHAAKTNKTRHFYLHRVLSRLWNSLPAINQFVTSIRHKLREFYGVIFWIISTLTIRVLSLCVLFCQ